MKDKKETKSSKAKGKGGAQGFNIPDAPSFPGENNTGINNPAVELPAFNPPVPNRAWTAMRQGLDIDALTEQEKADMYMGKDSYF